MRHALPGIVTAALLAALAGCDTARDLEQGGAVAECARCHGFPPAAPHPTVASNAPACSVCHSTTIDPSGNVIAGGAHQNGVVDAQGGHAAGYANPAVHGPEAIGFLAGDAGALTCTDCHGTDYAGGTSGKSCNACHAAAATDWRNNCTFCHGAQALDYPAIANPIAAAPPEGVAGETAATSPRVGAHQRHLTGGTYSNAFTCATCHAVPTDLSHVDGATAVTPAGAGQRSLPSNLGTYTPATQTCAVYCHGSTITTPAPTAQWTAAGTLACTACHASRPTTGFHTIIGDHSNTPCASCHLGYVQNTSVDLALHVDGAKSVAFPTRGGGPDTSLTNPGWEPCSICHGPTGNANAPQF